MNATSHFPLRVIGPIVMATVKMTNIVYCSVESQCGVNVYTAK